MAPFFIDNMSDSASIRPSCRPVPTTGLGWNHIAGTTNAKHARAHHVPMPITARRTCNELLPRAVRDIRGGSGGADAGNGESEELHDESPSISTTSDEANSIIQSFEEELVRIRLQIEAEAEQQWEEWRREFVERRRMRKRLRNEEQEKQNEQKKEQREEQQEEMKASKEEDVVEYKDGNISSPLSDVSEEIVSESELILLDDDDEEELENADSEGIDNGMQSVEVVDDIVDGVGEDCDDSLINTQGDIGFIGDYDAPTDSDDELSGHEEEEAFQYEHEQLDNSVNGDGSTSDMDVKSMAVDGSDDSTFEIPKKRRSKGMKTKRKKKKKKKRKKSRHCTTDAKEERSDDMGSTSLSRADVALTPPTNENTGALRSPSFTRKVVFYVGFTAFLYLFKTILDTIVRMGLQ